MRIVRSTVRWSAVLLAVALTAGAAKAQNTKMPSTLRWGSGYLDVPVASVLPSGAITVTGSGFWVNLDHRLLIGPQGQIIGRGDQLKKFYSDASVAFGLFDRVELGATLQSLDDHGSGTVAGGFGRLALLRPSKQGLGLAVGVRYLTSPDYQDNVQQQPNRLGIPDPYFLQGYPGREDVNTNWTEYVVGSLALQGFESDWLPENDFTFSLGWGNGLFKDGDQLDWYDYADSNGWFAGAVSHLKVGDNALLNLMGEWNGFDLNWGAQLDLGGIRLGAHYLGSNYLHDVSIYRSPKWGVLASLALCPQDGGLLCKPALLERARPDTVRIRLPAPPPDTVVVTRQVAPPLPTGQAATICLATGENVSVLVTAQGDTLVGPSRTSIAQLRQSGVVFAGDYASGRTWFENNQDITFERRQYQKSGGTVRLNCPDLMRVGEYQGVPLFVNRGAERPYTTLYVPVTPGVWQPYESLRGTRG